MLWLLAQTPVVPATDWATFIQNNMALWLAIIPIMVLAAQKIFPSWFPAPKPPDVTPVIPAPPAPGPGPTPPPAPVITVPVDHPLVDLLTQLIPILLPLLTTLVTKAQAEEKAKAAAEAKV